jgi:phosphohistidine swiveling domain-containing protein
MVRVPACIDVEIVDPVRSLREARSIARRLAAQAWGVSADQALEAARAAARRLRGPLPDPRPFRRTRAVDAAEAGKLLGIVEGIGKWLMTEGRITHPKDLWRLGGTQLEAAVRDGSVITPRTGPDPWEPFAFAAVAGSGRRYWGTSAAPGVGAGPAHLVGHGGPLSAQPRAVLVAAHPLPQLAPMLWSCAGIVTASNSVGAHLFDVARSLKVPAVAGVDLTGSVAGEGEAVVAVDGNAGTAAVLGPGGDSGDGELWG